MEEIQLSPAKWIEIEEAFDNKFGWDDALSEMCRIKRETVGIKTITALSLSEEFKLIQALRHYYKVNGDVLDKRKGKPNDKNNNKNKKNKV